MDRTQKLVPNASDMTELIWRKSPRSNPSGNCVETANVDDGMLVRDSKDRSGPVLGFTADVWTAFVEGVKDGEFDR